MLKSIFTWWNGATIGIRFTVARHGVFVGEDDYGNRYYEGRDSRGSYDDHKRRWVIYRELRRGLEEGRRPSGTVGCTTPSTGRPRWSR